MLPLPMAEIDISAVPEASFNPYSLNEVILEIIDLFILESFLDIGDNPGEAMCGPRFGNSKSYPGIFNFFSSKFPSFFLSSHSDSPKI